MRRVSVLLVMVLLVSLAATSLCFAATTVEGSGKQTRGYGSHNAELHGDIFVLPRAGTITNVTGEGTDGFWIEKADGQLVANFNTFKEAIGYSLPAGSYRVLPNLRDYPTKASRSWVRITVNCP